MTRRYLDLGSASDWLKQFSRAARPIRNTTQIWVVTRHQYGISAVVSQTLFCRGKIVAGGVAKCRLFSQANKSSPNHFDAFDIFYSFFLSVGFVRWWEARNTAVRIVLVLVFLLLVLSIITGFNCCCCCCCCCRPCRRKRLRFIM